MFRVYIGNIPQETQPEEIKKLFQTFGEVNEIEAPKNSNGQYKNFMYVSYNEKEDYEEAVFNMDGFKFKENHLKVQKGKQKQQDLRKPIWDTAEYQEKYLNKDNDNNNQFNMETKNFTPISMKKKCDGKIIAKFSKKLKFKV